MQKTDYDSSKLSENPVTSYLLCDETLTMPYLQPLQVKPSDISGDNQAYVIPKSTERSEIRVVYLDGSTITTQNFFLQSSDTYDYCYWWYNSDTELISLRVHTINHEQREDFKSDKIKWIELVSVGTVYKQVSGWPTEVQDSSSNWSMNDDYTLGSPVVYDSYEGNTGVLSFDT